MSLRFDGPANPTFHLARQPGRLVIAVLMTCIFQGTVLFLVYSAGRMAFEVAGTPTAAPPLAQLVFLAEDPGPGGGGGGGGNRMAAPPRAAEAAGSDRITVRVAPAISPQASVDPNPIDRLVVPVQAMSAGIQDLIGAVQAPGGPPTQSQGPGTGGGAGDGGGVGDGPGTGPGLDAGSGGDTGGGPRGSGSNVRNPELLDRVDPKYTSEAAARRIEGEVIVECTVSIRGVCTDTRVVRSLDPQFGLDQAAVRAAQQWRFRPGRRPDGQPVAVAVRIAIAFTIR